MGSGGRTVWASRAPDPNRPQHAAPAVNTTHRPGERLAHEFDTEARAAGLTPDPPTNTEAEITTSAGKRTKGRKRTKSGRTGPRIGHPDKAERRE
jgi:hypothetical protein